jgi:Flp pilus assembly protein TadD
MLCSGQVQPQAYTQADGGFAFSVGGDQAQRVNARDADQNQPSTPVGARGEDQSFVNLSQCEVRAALAGYRSTSVKLGRRSVFESPDIGLLILSPVDPTAGTFSSQTTLSAPKEAKKAFEKAQKEASKKKPNLEQMARDLTKAVEAYPQFADAWNLRGEILAQLGDLQNARESFNRAIGADSLLVTPYLNLALLELQEKHPSEALDLTERVLHLIPTLAEAQFYNGLAHATLGNLEAAQASLMAVAESPDLERFPRALFILGNIHAQTGDLAQAEKEYNRYLELEPDSRAADQVKETLADWKKRSLIN